MRHVQTWLNSCHIKGGQDSVETNPSQNIATIAYDVGSHLILRNSLCPGPLEQVAFLGRVDKQCTESHPFLVCHSLASSFLGFWLDQDGFSVRPSSNLHPYQMQLWQQEYGCVLHQTEMTQDWDIYLTYGWKNLTFQETLFLNLCCVGQHKFYPQ